MINITDMANLYISLTGSVTTKLDELYAADKIDAETYAKIISQAFENAMQLSVTAVQQQAQIDKDIELKNAQISQVLSQTTNTVLEGQNIYKQGVLLDKQALQVAAQTLLTNKQELQVIAETLNVPKQGLVLDVQKDDVIKGTQLKEAQIVSASVERAVLANNAAKASAERDLLLQKKITEIDGLTTSASQRSVLAAQATGYAKDADQKSADILMKGFAVLANANDFNTGDGDTYGVTSTRLVKALNTLVPVP